MLKSTLLIAALLVSNCAKAQKILLKGEINTVLTQQIKSDLNSDKSTLVEVEINSYGGDLSAEFDIQSLLQDSGKQVTCFVKGVANSAAFYLFESSACQNRVMLSTSTIAVHKPSITITGQAYKIIEAVASLEIMETAVETSICLRTHGKLSLQQLESRINRDSIWTIDAPTALKLGLTDSIMN